ncbi:MAG: DUF3881 family protein [Lachnospiraceae bacterium]|nr:DUF3881 family protein [Lachnospiraceae bacterium]
MHKYLRAIGFSNIKNNREMHDIVMEILTNATSRSYTTKENDTALAQFSKDFSDSFGIAVCGEYDNEDHFAYEYYYPYFIGSGVTTEEDITIEMHADRESYAGVCDDPRVGVTLVFYLQNMIPYVRIKNNHLLPIRGTTMTMSALSTNGTILLALEKNQEDVDRVNKDTKDRSRLVAKARRGDEDAIETLTLKDMDTYNLLSRKIINVDLLTLVDTYFMPYGVECDQYSVLGEIASVRSEKNSYTGEEIYILGLNCNDLTFDVCINKIDLYGEPKVGRRFKGIIWLQGRINFPEETK